MDDAKTQHGTMLKGLGHRLEKAKFKCFWESGRDEVDRLLSTKVLMAQRLLSRIVKDGCQALIMDIEWAGLDFDGIDIVECAINELGLKIDRRMVVFATIHARIPDSIKKVQLSGYAATQVRHKDADAFDAIVEHCNGLFHRE